jgi:nucleoside-diphosphate-sugar epimerase
MNSVVQAGVRAIVAALPDGAELDGATVVITGAGGFLGAWIALVALESGAHVTGLVRDEKRARNRLGSHPALELVVGDAADPPELAGDYFVHAASPATPRAYGVDPVGTIAPNTIGTHALLRMARDTRSRGLLFVSSGEIYGQVEEIPTPETAYGAVDPTDVRSVYAEGKRAGETLCVAWHVQYGVPAVIARPFHTYGPMMALDDGRVHADFIAALAEGRDLQMRSDGRAFRAFCYVADVVAGLFTVLLRGEPGTAYNVGSDEQISVGELAALLAQEFGVSVVRAPVRSGYLESPISRNCPNIERIARLGWRPTTKLIDGFRLAVESYR